MINSHNLEGLKFQLEDDQFDIEVHNESLWCEFLSWDKYKMTILPSDV